MLYIAETMNRIVCILFAYQRNLVSSVVLLDGFFFSFNISLFLCIKLSLFIEIIRRRM